MKKKLLVVLLSLVCSICLVLGLSACGEASNSGTDSNTISADCEHSFSAWTVGAEATCTSIGYKSRVCADCGYTEYQFTEATGHTYSTDAITSDYYTHMLKCTTCNEIITQTHTYNSENVCEVCNHHYYSEGLEFTVCYDDDGNSSYAVSGGNCIETEIVIPSVYKGYPVTQINNSAFYGFATIKSIIMPDSITSIGNMAFNNCTLLASITIPDNVTFIGYYAFRDCTSLESITIPDSVTSIGVRAFESCIMLESITIPDSVTTIENFAFANCSSLESVTIGSGVTSIGEAAFDNCNSLESVTFKNTSGWYISSSSTDVSGTGVDVTDPNQNATYLTSTYNCYYWYRSQN